VPTLRPIRRAASKEIARWPGDRVLELAARLLDAPDVVPRWIPYELIHHHGPALEGLDARIVEDLGAGIASWGEVDPFATYVAGVAWRKGRISDVDVHRWARSPDRWWRRAALVSTVALNNRTRGGQGDIERTLAVCELLATDRDDMVVKAMSWALRELVKVEPDAVRAFITAWESDLAARVLREVRNKLESGLKSPRRR
jgi:3-methyladenine DNA glycosylase AlkD